MDVSIIVVSYNTKDFTQNCLKSVFEKVQGVNFEIYVVDNNSSDGSCEMIEQEFPQVKLIKNKDNKGFGAANNIAIRDSKAKYVFLLNSDTVLLNNSVKIFFDFMEENQKVSCCGGNLYDKDLTYRYSYGSFPTIKSVLTNRLYLDKIFKSPHKKTKEPLNILTVDSVSGANMFLRRSVLDEVGLFDEDFFLYYEETELSWRMKKSGYKSVIVPDAKIMHLEGASEKASSNKIKIVRQSELMFFEKCYGKSQKNIVKLIHAFEKIPRFLVKKFKHKLDKKNINILHLISSLEVGGAEKLLIDLLKNSEQTTGANFTVVVMNDIVNDSLKKELLGTNLDVYFLNRKQSSKNIKFIFELLGILNKHKIDIIHSHNYGSKSWSILCKLLKPKIKLIFTVHCMGVFKKLSRLKLFLHEKFIDMNIAISKAVLAECNNFKINKSVLIYDGIKIENFSRAENKPNDTNLFKIINVSRVNHLIKGQDILIKALRTCKDKGLNFKCNFVGGIYTYGKESFEYLENLINELGLENEIFFLGIRTNIYELLSESDLFVLPSRYEGLGLSIIEAMSAKVPVIASNIDGPAELITNDENGLLFESENYLDLADKILYLYNNKDKREVLADNACEYVKRFDISVMRDKYCELYRNLTN